MCCRQRRRTEANGGSGERRPRRTAANSGGGGDLFLLLGHAERTLAGLSAELPASASPAPPDSEVAAFLDRLAACATGHSSDLRGSVLCLAGSSASTAAATASAGLLRPASSRGAVASPPRSDSQRGDDGTAGSGWRSRRAVADALERRRQRTSFMVGRHECASPSPRIPKWHSLAEHPDHAETQPVVPCLPALPILVQGTSVCMSDRMPSPPAGRAFHLDVFVEPYLLLIWWCGGKVSRESQRESLSRNVRSTSAL